MKSSRFSVNNIAISITSISHALSVIEQSLEQNKLGYICVTNSRTAYIANHDEKYCHIQNDSLLTVPDGMPLVWIARNLGFDEVERVSGKELMDALFEISVEKGYSHYFFGSTPHTISQLQKNLCNDYPGLKIEGAVSPPFQPIEEFNIETLAGEINMLKPTFFWCGLGAPKQERLIAMLQPRLESTICVGVGLAFEYISGTVKRAPSRIQKSGLEGIYNISRSMTRAKRFAPPFFWILIQLAKSYKHKLSRF